MVMNTLEGLDVSVYQNGIFWENVRREGKKSFAFIKASEGTKNDGYEDPRFAGNWSGSRDQGLVRIAYHFFYDHLNPEEQVDFNHQVVHDNGKYLFGDSLMVDVEEES